MRVIVQVVPEVAKSLRRGKTLKAASAELGWLADDLAVELRPLHPAVDDEALQSYFAIEVPNDALAKKTVDQFRRCPAIRAAYVKPPAAPA